jgi:diguanylate cyclase (GGDEF)-like protein
MRHPKPPRRKGRHPGGALREVLRQKKILGQQVLMYHRLMRVMRDESDFEDVLKLIVDSAVGVVGFDRAGIFLPRAKDPLVLDLVMGINDKRDYEKDNFSFTTVNRAGADPFSDIMFRHKKYFMSNNIPKRRTRKVQLADIDRRVLTHAIVPMGVGQGRIIGLLAVDNLFSRRPITKLDVLSLMNFATQAGLVIESFRMHEKIRDLTVKDGLTGVFNRRYFDQYLPQEVLRCRRYGRPLSLLYVDLDRFKAINDLHGHPAGDLVLRHLAGQLVAGLRDVDIVVRMGGDEFAVILPEVGPEGAQIAAERLFKSIAQNYVSLEPLGLPGVNITVSMGIASLSDSILDYKDLVRLADESLYKAKGSGGNRLGEFVGNSRQAAP